MRIRSPGYPSINLREAVDLAEKIFNISRQNVIDREAAAKDIGYSGLTGQSAKMLANLAHYGLVEKAGKGGIRVSDRAVRILHPHRPDDRRAALAEAAYSPELFASIQENWPDGFVSENALRSYLMRQGFSSSAVQPALSSFMETYGYLQQEQATESHGQRASSDHNEGRSSADQVKRAGESRALVPMGLEASPPTVHHLEAHGVGVGTMDGERVVFVEESSPSQYLKLVARGDVDEALLEALEDYLNRQKRRLQKQSTANQSSS